MNGVKSTPLTKGDHDPDEVHEEIVDPEVVPLRSTVRHSMDVVVEQTGCVVQGIAVQMGHADHDLEWMAQGILAEGEIGHIVAERSPDQLLGERSASWFVVCRSTAARAMDKTYHRDGLHTQHQRVCCHIPRIRQGVLFPQLPERILSSAHAIIVGDEVAFEETVEGPSWSWSVMP